MEYLEKKEIYVAQVAKYSDTMKKLKKEDKSSQLEDPQHYLQQAITCYTNTIRILCGFNFSSKQAKEIVALAFYKIFESCALLGQSYSEKVTEFMDWRSVNDVSVKSYPFAGDMKRLIIEQLQKDGKKEDVEKV